MEVPDREDEIIKLADSIDWDFIDEVYSRSFTNKSLAGNPNPYSSRVVCRVLLIKQMLGLTDQ